MSKVTFTHATYLGGLKDSPSRSESNFIATDTTIGLGVLSPKKGAADWTDVAWVDVEDDEVRKSRAGKVVMFGPLGLLGAKTQSAVDVTVGLKDGRVGHFQIKRASAFDVRAKLHPLMKAAGVPLRDDTTSVADDPHEQLRKLASLHTDGLLTDDEYAAKKAALLARM